METLAKIMIQRHGCTSEAIRANHRPIAVTYLSPHTYVLGRSRLELYQNFDLIAADSTLSLIALKMAGLRTARRGAFDLSSDGKRALAIAADRGLSLYLFGASKSEVETAAARLSSAFPGLNVCGTRSGYFGSRERKEILADVSRLGPDLVVLSLGYPLQDEIAVELKSLGLPSVITTAGGFVTQTARELEFYPAWIVRYNLRWLYRLVRQPHVIKRLVYYPIFVILFAYDLLLSQIKR